MGYIAGLGGERLISMLYGAGAVGLYSLLGGAMHGATLRGEKTFKLEGMSDSVLKETLDYLRKKARILNFQ